MRLRQYQQQAIDDIYAWFKAGNEGNPCVVMATGSGKSHVIAAFCKDALSKWPDIRILMLTHQKELIEQNAEKMRLHWPGAPLGIYSASIGKRQLGEPITFAGIGSVRNRAKQLGYVDIVLVDECHRINHKAEGGYRKLIRELKQRNSNLRVIGFTATPYRLGHGLITDEPAIFNGLIEPASIEQLIYGGYLSKLRSKQTNVSLDVTGVKKRGGEYVEKELQAAVDKRTINTSVVSEITSRGENRKAWLLFCTGVGHAENIKNELLENGIKAACVTGITPKRERERILSDFKSGKIRAITNCDVLTTGFNHDGIDLIAMLRPTMSAVLYIQMAGRGMRISPGKTDCLVLDFAGNIAMHGPITNVQAPTKKGDGSGEAPTKTCPDCSEIIHASVMLCPSCGYKFPPVEKPLKLRNDDIMGGNVRDMEVSSWLWRKHVGRSSGKGMLMVTYYGALSDKPVNEYLVIAHDGYPGQKALQRLAQIAQGSGANLHTPEIRSPDDFEVIAKVMQASTPPAEIIYKKNGRLFDVISRRWH